MDSNQQTVWGFIGDTPEVAEIYADSSIYFPKEVRANFASWIEEQSWEQLDPDNPSHNPVAEQLSNQLFTLLSNKANELNKLSRTFPQAQVQLRRLVDIANTLERMYGSNALELVRVIKHCLSREADVFDAMQSDMASTQNSDGGWGDGSNGGGGFGPGIGGGMGGGMGGMMDPILGDLLDIESTADAEEHELDSIEEMQEAFRVNYLETEARKSDPPPQNHPDFRAWEQDIRATTVMLARESEQLIDLRQRLKTSMGEQGAKLEQLAAAVHVKLQQWQVDQWRENTSVDILDAQLSTIKGYYRKLAHVVWSLKRRLYKWQFLHAQLPPTTPLDGPSAEDLSASADNLFANILHSSWVITIQPPSVIKKNSKFLIRAELLIGGGLTVDSPTVGAGLVDEERAVGIEQTNNIPDSMAGKLLNNNKRLEVNRKNGDFGVEFSHMAVREVQESSGGGSGGGDKFAIFLAARVTFGDQPFDLLTMSNPVVVITSSKQLCAAEGVIFWDKSFGSFPRIGFSTPDRVFWNSMAEALSAHFDRRTGRALSSQDLNYLRTKLISDNEADVVTLQRFTDDELPSSRGRGVTFWRWAYHILVLMQTALGTFWRDGHIAGFVPKGAVYGVLSKYVNGAFLLRFSDSLLGGVSVCYLDASNGMVVHLQPWIKSELDTIKLADRIRDTENLTMLVPSMKDKDEVFGPEYTPLEGSPDLIERGYVSTGLRMTVQGGGGVGSSNSPGSNNAAGRPNGRGFQNFGGNNLYGPDDGNGNGNGGGGGNFNYVPTNYAANLGGMSDFGGSEVTAEATDYLGSESGIGSGGAWENPMLSVDASSPFGDYFDERIGRGGGGGGGGGGTYVNLGPNVTIDLDSPRLDGMTGVTGGGDFNYAGGDIMAMPVPNGGGGGGNGPTINTGLESFSFGQLLSGGGTTPTAKDLSDMMP